MSQEDVEIVRSALTALSDHGVDALVEFLHPEINWRAMEGAPDDVGEMRGIEASRRYVEDWFETFDDVMQAIEGEKKIKGWLRSKKIALIETSNPQWNDLAKDWCVGAVSNLGRDPSVA